MTASFDLDAVRPRGDHEKHLGDGIINDVFADQATMLLQWKCTRKWLDSGDPSSPNVVNILSSNNRGDPNDNSSRDTGLELRRCARKFRKPMELVYRDPSNKKETLLAVIETIPTKDPSSSTTNTTIYSPEPSFKGQIPTSGKSAVAVNSSIPSTLYPRATIKKENQSVVSNYFEYFATIEMIEESSKIIQGRSMDASDGSTKEPSSTWYASEEAPGPTGPQTIIRKKGSGMENVSTSADIAASLVLKEKNLLMTIAPGIDPCLMICLAADRMNRMAVSNANNQYDCLDLLCDCFCTC